MNMYIIINYNITSKILWPIFLKGSSLVTDKGLIKCVFLWSDVSNDVCNTWELVKIGYYRCNDKPFLNFFWLAACCLIRNRNRKGACRNQGFSPQTSRWHSEVLGLPQAAYKLFQVLSQAANKLNEADKIMQW